MTLDEFIAIGEKTILVEIIATSGSTPREGGVFMLVSQSRTFGTIGGGNLEFQAISHAQLMLQGGDASSRLSIILGPETGQCCGGRVDIGFQSLDAALIDALKARITAEQAAWKEIVVYGAGHVGLALAVALKPLPFRLLVVETRSEEIAKLPGGIQSCLTPIPEQTVSEISPGSGVVIVTHDHGLDFLIATEALKRGDLAYVGMIGSRSKRGVFAGWLKAQGHPPSLIEPLILPIGGGAVADKRPEVIAALVAGELVTKLLGSPHP